MILQNLRYLTALAREKHFSRAAGACGVTQPTLSAGIKQLEEELGLLIVRRGQRFEGLTAEGERILEWARRILADCESLEQEAGVLRGGLQGRLRIGAIPTTLPAVSLLTLPFARLHPQVTISIYSLSSMDIQAGLDDFSLDAGLTYLDNEPLANVLTIPLYYERYLLFTPAGSPLADRETVSWGEVTGLPLCLLTPDMQNRRIVDGLFAAAGASVHPTIETNSVLTLWSHVTTGSFSSVLSQAFLYLFGEPPGIRAIPIVGSNAAHSVGLVVSDHEPLTPSARALAAVAATLEVTASLDGVRLEAGGVPR
jgi:DNA-binding transcriptional LysR family regulator